MSDRITGLGRGAPRTVSHYRANCSLSYTYKGVGYGAALRCRLLSIGYALNSEQSHSRQTDAFYPHRRSQGTFTVTFDCNGWAEYNAVSSWFAQFARQSLAFENSDPAVWMSVKVAARNFSRKGIPTTGMTFGDHVGSMVFNPAITFVSVNDPNDPKTNLTRTKDASGFQTQGVDPFAVANFYPNSKMNQPGAVAAQLYGGNTTVTAVKPVTATVAQDIINGGGHPTNVGQSYQTG